MPRQSRIDTIGALHHVIARGIERRKIFDDDHDYLLEMVKYIHLSDERILGDGGFWVMSPFLPLLRALGTGGAD